MNNQIHVSLGATTQVGATLAFSTVTVAATNTLQIRKMNSIYNNKNNNNWVSKHVSLGATTQIGATLAIAAITVATAYTLFITIKSCKKSLNSKYKKRCIYDWMMKYTLPSEQQLKSLHHPPLQQLPLPQHIGLLCE